MGFLNKIFGNKKSEQFLEALRSAARKHDPSIGLESGKTSGTINIYGTEFKTDGLLKKYEDDESFLTDFIDRELERFLRIYRPIDESASGFPQAESFLLPQLIPTRIAIGTAVAAKPYTSELLLSFLCTAGKPGFVKERDLQSWGKSFEDVHQVAFNNLEKAKYEIEATLTEGSDRFIGMETHDGFDAVRIMLPAVLQRANEKLGGSCYAGLPNSNFLILWAKDCSTRFHDYALEKIDQDYRTQPEPLSKTVYELSQDRIQKADMQINF